MMKNEVAELPAPDFTPEERRVLRDVLKRLSDAYDGRAVEVPGDHPLDDSFYFVPVAVRIEEIQPGDPRVDWDEHRRRVAWMMEQPPDGEITMEFE